MVDKSNLYIFAGSAVVLLALAGCTSSPSESNGILIDQKGVNMAAYQADLRECETYSEEINISSQASHGAVIGAVLGGAVGAMRNSDVAKRSAGAGAIAGGASGAGKAYSEKQSVVKNCLRGRGYKVLN